MRRMGLSPYLQAEQAFVERTLGESEICTRCRATQSTFSEACTADLSDACPGFLSIERCKEEFRRSRIEAEAPGC